MIDLVAVETVLHQLGIDPSGNPLENILEVMNFTVQCLGTIRVLFEMLEKQRRTNYFTSLNNANHYKQLGWQYWAIRKSFSYAVKRMVNEIILAEEAHNLNPARHIIETFPNNHAIGGKEWLPVHWAILGDIDEHPFIIEEKSYDNNMSSPTKVPQKYSDIGSQPPNSSDLQHSVSSKEKSAACDNDERILVINQLGLILPNAFRAVDNEGRSVLHIAARLDSVPLFDCVLANCQKYNGSTLQDVNHNGALPLHNAARFCKSIEVFQRVAAAYPAAMTARNHDMMLPLHWAAAKNRCPEIVRYLLQQYPEGIKVPNAEHYLPSHCSGQNDSFSVVKMIYDHYPDGIYIADHEGGLPFQHACCFTHNIAVISFLYDQYPDAIIQPQQDGITPIHLAAAQNDFPALIEFILARHPTAVFVEDSVKWLPVYCLINNIHDRKFSLALLDCLRILLHAGPVVNFQLINSLWSNTWVPSYPPGLHESPALLQAWNQSISYQPEDVRDASGQDHEPHGGSNASVASASTSPSAAKYNFISRLIFNSNVTKQPSFRNAFYEHLNWYARASAVYLMIHLSAMPLMTLSRSGETDLQTRKEYFRNYYLLEYFSKRQRIHSTTALCHSFTIGMLDLTEEILSKLVHADCERVVALQRLCHFFMAPGQRSIPVGVLRKIIKML